MNEQRKSYNDYMHPEVSKQQQTAEELLSVANELLSKHRNALTWGQKTYLINLVTKQLNKRHARIPSSVLRSIEKNLQNIKKQTQR